MPDTDRRRSRHPVYAISVAAELGIGRILDLERENAQLRERLGADAD